MCCNEADSWRFAFATANFVRNAGPQQPKTRRWRPIFMPVLTDQQRKFYETTLQVTKQEISDLKDQIEEELAKVKDRIADLQNAINASKQMYAAACNRLGVNNDMDDDDGGEG